MIQSEFIYVLESEGYGRLVLNGEGDNNLPLGFDEQRVSITRSPKYYGLFREFSTSLRFVKNGRDYIQSVYENEGTEQTINIGVYEYQPSPVDKYYLYFAGLIDLSTYTFTETYVECDINESSLNRKIVSRDDVKVNVADINSVEGVDMGVIDPVTVQLHEREIKLTANYIQAGDTVISSIGGVTNGCVLPFDLEAGNIDNLNQQTYGDPNSSTSLFWTKATSAAQLNIRGKLRGRMVAGVSKVVTVEVIIRRYTDDALTTFTDGSLYSFTGNLQSENAEFDIDLNLAVFNLGTNEQLAFITKSSEVDQYFTVLDEIYFEIEQNQLFDTTTANGYLMHEVGDRIIYSISDQQRFNSNFFGRTDIGYPVDGEGSLSTIHNGKQIRAIPGSNPSLTLADWFKGVSSIWGLGMGIEHDEVNQAFVRVEKRSHFFSGDVIATIHNVSEIKKEVAREWIYNECEVGYAKAEYEEVNGLEEYNNKFEWSSSINTIKNKLDLVSKLRADGYGIEFARRLQFADTPTEDSKYDNENFVVIVKRSGDDYASVRAENYDIVENIFSPDSAYNLDITPGRMIRNNGSMIRAGLEKYLDDPLRFRFAEQKADLKSQKIGSSAIVENEDIDVNTLDSPLWIPEIYSFSSVLTREQLAAITRNPNGIIKFSTTTKENTTKYYYGWVLDIDAENREATWQLLRVNTSSPDVVIKDPEGSTPETPPIIVDPGVTFGFFEGPFEFIFSG